MRPLSHKKLFSIPLFICLLSVSTGVVAAEGGADLTRTVYGVLALLVFGIAYALVVAEEFLGLRKSKPMLIAAGIIWVLVALAYTGVGQPHAAGEAFRHALLEYAEIMLFIVVAMTYINTLDERGIFAALRTWLMGTGYSLRTIYWLTGLLAFFISPFADNLTTALIMVAVALAVGAGQPRFIIVSCISIVVAANAGGAFSPFGDITTLMVWQKGVVEFHEFFALFIPALVNWLVPAVLMSWVVPRARPLAVSGVGTVKPGGYGVLALFVVSIVLTVAGHHLLALPPVLGMMTGLGLLKIYAYTLQRRDRSRGATTTTHTAMEDDAPFDTHAFDTFRSLRAIEWDTLLFFYGVILCVAGVGALGYLAALSNNLYSVWGPTIANTAIGVISAVIDNIPVMYAVLSMQPEMSHGQWLLVTLTAGVGGSLLSIGSAAGVAVMGQAPGVYTFMAHLRWTWAIALGYGASIAVHLWLNESLM